MKVLKCCTSFTTSKTHAVRDNIVFPLFCLFVWTGKIDLNLLHVDTHVFENLHFQKYLDTYGRALVMIRCSLYMYLIS